MEVRPCEEPDLSRLDASLALGGPYGHAHRLRGQAEGRWLYLIALDPSPVGSCLVQWNGPVDDLVREQLPDAVEITSLHVSPSARGRGAGKALIAEAELHAMKRRRPVIGVAAGDTNTDARRLYERLGYLPSGARYRAEYDYVDVSGTAHHEVEEGDFLVKELGEG